MSIRLRIATSMITLILCAYIMLFISTTNNIYQNNYRTTIEETIVLLDAKSKELGFWLSGAINEFRFLSEISAFKAMDMKTMLPYISSITEMKSNNPNEYSDYFAYGAFIGQSYINDTEIFQLLSRDDFLAMKNSGKEYVISDPKYVKTFDKEMIMIYYPITDYSGQISSFFCTGIPVEKIKNLVNQIDIFGGTSWIMNTNGSVYTMDEQIFSTIVNKNDQVEFIDLINRNTSGMETFDDYAIFYSQIPNSKNWVLCTKVNKNFMFSSSAIIVKDMTVITIFLSCVGIFLSILISRTLVKPIKELQVDMIMAERKNFKAYYTGTEKHEIYYLGQTYNHMLNTIQELFNKNATIEEEKCKAYLSTLQSQLNPHFLYNTLETLKWICIKEGAITAGEYIDDLSRFFRISLSDGAEKIMLYMEVQHIESYLKIQGLRYDDKFTYEISFDNSLANIYIPKLILQPIVENSIYHGLKYRSEKGFLSLKIFKQSENIVIIVSDNGIGIKPEKLKTICYNIDNNCSDNNFGLNCLRQRLKLHYNEKCKITIESEYLIGTTVKIIIPLGEIDDDKDISC